MKYFLTFLAVFLVAHLPAQAATNTNDNGPPNLMVEDECAENMEALIAKGEHSDRPLGCVYDWGRRAQIAVALDKNRKYNPGFSYFKIMMRKQGEVANQLLQANVPIEIPVGIGSTYLKEPNHFPAEKFSVDTKRRLLIVVMPAFCGEPEKTVEYRFDENKGFLVLKAIINEVPSTAPEETALTCVSNS